jgi:hypothetical protein
MHHDDDDEGDEDEEGDEEHETSHPHADLRTCLESTTGNQIAVLQGHPEEVYYCEFLEGKEEGEAEEHALYQ